MIQIWRIGKLAELLHLNVADIEEAITTLDDCCVEYRLITPQKAKKERTVLSTTGVLREVQDRLLNLVFTKRFHPSEFSHGGVHGRSIKTNASPHSKSKFIYKADVADFYPTISHNRLFRFFRKLGWPEEVSRICTRLCTYKHHLALGLATSPILADQIFTAIDARIAGACQAVDIVYTRFVDDITLSAQYHLDPAYCGVPLLIDRILAEHGFVAKREKKLHNRIDAQGISITGVRMRRGGLTATPEFCARVESHLAAAEAMAGGEDDNAEFYPEQHVLGQIQFVRWISSGRAVPLLRRFRRIDWALATDNARAHGRLVESKKLVRI